VWGDTGVVNMRRLRAARSVVLSGPDGAIACGALRRGPPAPAVARLRPLGGSGVDGLAVMRGRAFEASVRCRTGQRCTQLMEEEGIFYYARSPCPQAEEAGSNPMFALGPNTATQFGKAIDVHTVFERPTATTLRLQVNGADVACGPIKR
jgi:hypothetical protein